MTTAIMFDRVTKDFSHRESQLLKDLLLGIAGHRAKSRSHRALDQLSFKISEGESVAILGHNGCGKSTSLKLLAGVIAPSSGQILAKGRIAPLLELGSGFHPDLTGRENIYLNAAVLRIPRRMIDTNFNQIVEFAGLADYLDVPVKFYSSGMLVRLGFSIAINVQPDILLLDEVLAVGDAEFQEKSYSSLQEFRTAGKTILLVTHDLHSAESFCDRALVLSHGQLIFDGKVTDAGDALHSSRR